MREMLRLVVRLLDSQMAHERPGLLARALRNLDAMGAKSIGIDMVFDQPQDEDDQLVATLRGMKTPTSRSTSGCAWLGRHKVAWPPCSRARARRASAALAGAQHQRCAPCHSTSVAEGKASAGAVPGRDKRHSA